MSSDERADPRVTQPDRSCLRPRTRAHAGARGVRSWRTTLRVTGIVAMVLGIAMPMLANGYVFSNSSDDLIMSILWHGALSVFWQLPLPLMLVGGGAIALSATQPGGSQEHDTARPQLGRAWAYALIGIIVLIAGAVVAGTQLLGATPVPALSTEPLPSDPPMWWIVRQIAVTCANALVPAAAAAAFVASIAMGAGIPVAARSASRRLRVVLHAVAWSMLVVAGATATVMVILAPESFGWFTGAGFAPPSPWLIVSTTVLAIAVVVTAGCWCIGLLAGSGPRHDVAGAPVERSSTRARYRVWVMRGTGALFCLPLIISPAFGGLVVALATLAAGGQSSSETMMQFNEPFWQLLFTFEWHLPTVLAFSGVVLAASSFLPLRWPPEDRGIQATPDTPRPVREIVVE